MNITIEAKLKWGVRYYETRENRVDRWKKVEITALNQILNKRTDVFPSLNFISINMRIFNEFFIWMITQTAKYL